MKAPTLVDRLLRRPKGPASLATVTAQVDDSPGWSRFSASASNERAAAEIQEQYQDALTAWRKNPSPMASPCRSCSSTNRNLPGSSELPGRLAHSVIPDRRT